MITEEQLNDWEARCDTWSFAEDECYDVVPKLINYIRKLEKEAEWLTEFVCSEYGCPTPKENCKSFDCVNCWREAQGKQRRMDNASNLRF